VEAHDADAAAMPKALSGEFSILAGFRFSLFAYQENQFFSIRIGCLMFALSAKAEMDSLNHG
jgi:hypothetical protein